MADSRSNLVCQDTGIAVYTCRVGEHFPLHPARIYEALRTGTERATIEFYLGRVGEFVGYPMLSALLGVYAAWIGDRERSLELFEQGYADFILEPFTETDEFSRKKFPEKPRVGPFQANLGGFLSACVFGLPGIRVGPEDPAEWARRPVTLPSGWEAIEVERVWVRNRPASLRATHGADRADLRFSED